MAHLKRNIRKSILSTKSTLLDMRKNPVLQSYTSEERASSALLLPLCN
jgi:hypothetical protein